MKIFKHLRSDWFRYGFETLAVIVVNDLNFVRMISHRFPEINIDNEPENNYPLLLENQRIRNLIAVKLSLTSVVIRYRRELDAEIKSLISLLEAEIEHF